MDKQTVDKIITEYLHKIYGFAMKKSFSYDEAEDLCADIIAEVYLSLLRAKEVVNPEGYVWRISEHTYAKYVSRKKQHEGVSINEMEIPYYEDFISEDSEDEIKQLRREIAFLTEKRRKIVYLFYYENRSVSYISKTTGIPLGTVKWHLNKARNELKEGFLMERKIGRLGISPISASNFGHSGNPGNSDKGPEFYLDDKLNLNIVYSVYFEPKTKEEIAAELGITPVFIEDKISFLEENGFLVRTAGNRFTTYVHFSPETFSLEQEEKKLQKQLEIAKRLVQDYVPAVRAAISDIQDVYIPGGNRELLEAAAIFYGVQCKCGVRTHKDLSCYTIKTTAGGSYIAYVDLDMTQSDPEYQPQIDQPPYWACGGMYRSSDKYPTIYSWSVDTRYCSRNGRWQNNLYTDYEYLYEFITGMIHDSAANAEKFKRLKDKKYLTEDNKVNIMVLKGDQNAFFKKIPELDDAVMAQYADFILEAATIEAKNYPPQMQDLVISNEIEGFIASKVALMVMDELYANGTFRPLTENEKVTSNLIMFSDVLPGDTK